jgi:SAM-dependent methyltransferase
MPGLEEERDRLAREYGPWRDRIELAPGLFTGDRLAGAAKGKAILQVAADAVGDLGGASVIDLGAAEGLFSIEFARHGAEVVAVDGRLGNVEKMRFAQRALGLSNLEAVHRDVRELDTSRRYDVVLCLGLLYHLEGHAAVKLCHDLAAITERVAVIDTHVAPHAREELQVNGRSYWGRPIREFDPGAPADEQERLSRSAIGNPEAFWLTRSSLFNLLEDAGFTSVLEVFVPHVPDWHDRVILACLRGRPRALEAIVGDQTARWMEGEEAGRHPSASWRAEAKRRFAPYVPRAVKELARHRRRQMLRL